IQTARGEVAVEDLRESDRVMTISGAWREVTWIGHRHVDLRRHPEPDLVMPIRVAPHTFGPGMPKRPLLLSPDHAVFVDDALIPIRCLVNFRTVAPERCD